MYFNIFSWQCLKKKRLLTVCSHEKVIVWKKCSNAKPKTNVLAL